MSEIMLLQNLIDFFEGKGQFKIRNDYLGMEASSIPDIFINYFKGLKHVDKDKTVELIVAGSLGREKRLHLYVAFAIHLALRLCMENYTQLFKKRITLLEEEFNNQENVNKWISSDEKTPIAEGILYKKNWHYALDLWGLLYLLGSNEISVTYNNLIENTRHPRFSEALKLAQQTYNELL